MTAQLALGIEEVAPPPAAVWEQIPPERQAEVVELFDRLAPEWSSRDVAGRKLPIVDALDRGVAAAPVAERTVALELGGGSGVNVTLPFKEAAYDWVTEYDEYAGTAGAVNTIVVANGGYLGCNTDGIGLVRDGKRKDV